VRIYWEHVEEHIGNLRNMLGVHHQLDENIEGTSWEHSGKKKKNWSPFNACCLTSLVARMFFAHPWSLLFLARANGSRVMNYGGIPIVGCID
jgi:hypothetical protein